MLETGDAKLMNENEQSELKSKKKFGPDVKVKSRPATVKNSPSAPAITPFFKILKAPVKQKRASLLGNAFRCFCRYFFKFSEIAQ